LERQNGSPCTATWIRKRISDRLREIWRAVVGPPLCVFHRQRERNNSDEKALKYSIYKYMRSEHMSAALTEGLFRIGTLHEFRDTERLGAVIGDESEGKRSSTFTPENSQEFDLLSDDPRAIHARKVFKGWDQFAPGSTIRVRMEPRSSLELIEDSPDLYVFCASTRFDPGTMAEFGYDSCLRIANPAAFIRALSRSMEPYANYFAAGEIHYGRRKDDFRQFRGFHAAFLKPEIYSAQREYRAAWVSRQSMLEPRVIACREASRYCVAHR
jgi:hypothetical protein